MIYGHIRRYERAYLQVWSARVLNTDTDDTYLYGCGYGADTRMIRMIRIYTGEDTVRIRCGYGADTVRIRCGYGADTVHIRKDLTLVIVRMLLRITFNIRVTVLIKV